MFMRYVLIVIQYLKTEDESPNHLPPLKLTYLNCTTLQLNQSGVFTI